MTRTLSEIYSKHITTTSTIHDCIRLFRNISFIHSFHSLIHLIRYNSRQTCFYVRLSSSSFWPNRPTLLLLNDCIYGRGQLLVTQSFCFLSVLVSLPVMITDIHTYTHNDPYSYIMMIYTRFGNKWNRGHNKLLVLTSSLYSCSFRVTINHLIVAIVLSITIMTIHFFWT